MSNITQVVKDEKNMTTFQKGVLASGLDKILSGAGPFTVFAPSDLAFGKLEAGAIENLLKPENKQKLVQILTYHVVAGNVTAKDVVKLKDAKTVQGGSVKINAKQGVRINDATVIKADVMTTNGVIHVIDTVLLPKH